MTSAPRYLTEAEEAVAEVEEEEAETSLFHLFDPSLISVARRPSVVVAEEAGKEAVSVEGTIINTVSNLALEHCYRWMFLFSFPWTLSVIYWS